MEELLVTEQPPNPVQPTEFTLVLGFLREDIQDIRQIHERIDALRTEVGERIDQIGERINQTNGRIDDLAKQFDSCYG